MKLIALTKFYNVGKAIKLGKDQNPANDYEIPKGAIFEVGSEAKFEHLQPAEKQFVASLNMANRVGDATDPKIVALVKAELAEEARSKAAAEARMKASTRELVTA